MQNRLILISLLIVSLSVFSQEIDISKGWVFKTGDSLVWAKPTYNSKNWQPIEVNRFWESQGQNNYDGYGWYRNSFFISSDLKKNSTLKDSIRILLGKIDDHDQVFLNGILIAQNAGMPFLFGSNNNDPNGSAYNKNRRYALPANHKSILWDKQNTIAIRVFDQMGNGGMGEGKKYSFGMVDLLDNAEIDLNAKAFTFLKDGSVQKEIWLKSSAKESLILKGTLNVGIYDRTSNKILKEFSTVAEFSSKKSFNYTFNFVAYENAIVKYKFTDGVSKNSISETQEIPFILTPLEKPEPQINNAKVFGVRPGSPILFKIAASGEYPMTFGAENLPNGLKIDPKSGIISGSMLAKGEFKTNITAQNSKGKTAKELKIVVGDVLALTPPMGWNSWNCWGMDVSEEKVRSSAKAMVDKGLINYGWSYMNIDDGWQGIRDANGIIQTNEKFPDMKKLSDYIHSLGLKTGIYSSPGTKTCGDKIGSYGFEQKDVDQYVSWDMDYLKHDWCSYTDVVKDKIKFNGWNPEIKTAQDTEVFKIPYRTMQKSLETAKRDIVYSLCQYGMAEVWKWGSEVNANCWRTTMDIEDSWNSLYLIGFSQTVQFPYAKPGRWNDPDMLIVGKVGWGTSLRNSRLTVNEQYTHISLWSLLASPLLIGCDMSQLDDFTLGLLKNAEVINVNQDPLGKQAKQVESTAYYQVWIRELEDGSKAVGIFNVSQKDLNIKINFEKLGIKAGKNIRDIWRQKDLGKFDKGFESFVAAHGVRFIKIKD